MDDKQIVELYFERSTQAIAESQQKYGRYCGAIAMNILRSPQDAEECVNDTWDRAWESIPPTKPTKLSVFLGSVTRHLAIDRYRKAAAEKRGGSQAALCIEELSECVSGGEDLPSAVELRDALERFLRGISEDSRRIFMLRYWYVYSVKEVARICSKSEGAVKMSLSRTRKELKEFLEKEDIAI